MGELYNTDYLNPLAQYGIPGVSPAPRFSMGQNFAMPQTDVPAMNYGPTSMEAAAMNNVGQIPAAAPGAGGFDWGGLFKGAIGTKEAPGWGGMALGAIQGLAGAYMGMQQYGLAKDAFNESKRQFQMNWDAQKKTTNAALADRQASRLAANPGAYQSVGDYMKQYGI